jgi:hypothetical protein
MIGEALKKFFAKYSEDIPKYALSGAISAGVGVPIAYGAKELLGDDEAAKLEEIAKDIRSVKRKVRKPE